MNLRLFLLCCLVSFSSFNQEVFQIPFLESVDIDGSSKEWQHIESYNFSTSNADTWDVNGNFSGNKDLDISYKAAWNKDGLYFHITWEDDKVDEKVIPKDSSTYKTPSGHRMDRMYLYDNLKIQIRHEGLNYSSWFSLRENGLQWYSLRERKEGKSTTLQSSEPEFKYVKRTKNKYTIEIKFAWEDLHMTSDMELSLLFLVSDTDFFQTDLKDRLQGPRAFISQSKTIKFQ